MVPLKERCKYTNMQTRSKNTGEIWRSFSVNGFSKCPRKGGRVNGHRPSLEKFFFGSEKTCGKHTVVWQPWPRHRANRVTSQHLRLNCRQHRVLYLTIRFQQHARLRTLSTSAPASASSKIDLHLSSGLVTHHLRTPGTLHHNLQWQAFCRDAHKSSFTVP